MRNKKYAKYYSEQLFWNKVTKHAKNAGIKVVYAALVLFYAMKSMDVSIKTKVSIAAALDYFILPTDAIFDLTPVIGYSDDLGILLFVLSKVASSIIPESKIKALQKISEWYGGFHTSELCEVESKI